METEKMLWFAATMRPVGGGRWAVIAVLGYPSLECARACRDGMHRSCGHDTFIWPGPPEVDADVLQRSALALAAIRAEVARKWGEKTAQEAEANARALRTAPHAADLPARRLFAANMLRGDAADVAVIIVRASGTETAMISRNSTGRLKAAIGRAQRAAAPRRAPIVNMCDNDRR